MAAFTDVTSSCLNVITASGHSWDKDTQALISGRNDEYLDVNPECVNDSWCIDKVRALSTSIILSQFQRPDIRVAVQEELAFLDPVVFLEGKCGNDVEFHLSACCSAGGDTFVHTTECMPSMFGIFERTNRRCRWLAFRIEDRKLYE